MPCEWKLGIKLYHILKTSILVTGRNMSLVQRHCKWHTMAMEETRQKKRKTVGAVKVGKRNGTWKAAKMTRRSEPNKEIKVKKRQSSTQLIIIELFKNKSRGRCAHKSRNDQK
jgi:hypothetical protein